MRRDKPAWRSECKSHTVEGLATHAGPESCAVVRKDGGEALTGEHAGQVWSRENLASQGPTHSCYAEGYKITDVIGESVMSLARSETLHMRRHSMRENREIHPLPRRDGNVGRLGKARSRTPRMDGGWKSDTSVVPTKSPNNTLQEMGVAEGMEGRDVVKDHTVDRSTPRTQRRTRVPEGLARVHRRAQQDKRTQFTALLHHVTVAQLRTAFEAIQRQAAPGVDGVTWSTYAEHLEAHLQDLHGRVQRGTYRSQPTRRTYIPKADGRLRPLGVAALEDKIVQRAVVEVIQAIYEADFLGFSYGFRPGRGPHQALDALAVGIQRRKVGWVLDADIRGFFDTISHEWLQQFLRHRIADRRILRLVQQWLRAGVMEQGAWTATEVGTPQGATVSPLLANVYLHYVFDLWVQRWRQRHARGQMIVTRWADDFVVGFQYRTDAERFLGQLRERFQQFALALHPEKTRLIEFGRFASDRRRARGLGKPETFAFLGFTHICARSRRGEFQLRRQTMRTRMRAKLQAVKAELRRRWHHSMTEQGTWLASVVRGHIAYYAVPNNLRAVSRFRTEVTRHWYRALHRRGQRGRLPWSRMTRVAARWLPPARISHPWPNERFDGRV